MILLYEIYIQVFTQLSVLLKTITKAIKNLSDLFDTISSGLDGYTYSLTNFLKGIIVSTVLHRTNLRVNT